MRFFLLPKGSFTEKFHKQNCELLSEVQNCPNFHDVNQGRPKRGH